VSAVPPGIVKSRRRTGALLLVASLATIAAVVIAIGVWLTAPPVVRPIPSGLGGTTTGYSLPTAPGSGSAPTSPPTPGEQLAALRRQDAAAVADIPDGYWVPQLGSNRVGIDTTGRQWDEQAILDDHDHWRSYGGVLLVSSDFRTYKYAGYWVTVVPAAASSDPGTVIAWCDRHGLPGTNCLAKRLSTTSTYAGDNTRNRP